MRRREDNGGENFTLGPLQSGFLGAKRLTAVTPRAQARASTSTFTQAQTINFELSIGTGVIAAGHGVSAAQIQRAIDALQGVGSRGPVRCRPLPPPPWKHGPDAPTSTVVLRAGGRTVWSGTPTAGSFDAAIQALGGCGIIRMLPGRPGEPWK